MTSKTSGSRKLKRKNLPKFNHDIYSRISSRNLFVYSVHYLLEQEIEVRMEDIVFACFLLFPQKFALKKYPRWPDSAVVSRRMNDCRSQGYVAANTEFGFKLTAKGSRLAEKVAKVLGVSTAKRAVKVLPSQPKAVTPAKEVKPEISKKKITLPAPIKKVQSSLPNVNVIISKPAQKDKIILPAPIGKVQTSRLKNSPSAQVKKTQSPPKRELISLKPEKKAHPIQPAPASLAIPTKKIKPSKPTVRPVKLENTQFALFKEENLVVPKEVKIRAGKFVHLMERSDAYIHYKKNGKNSKIGEFDFRSLLLCTMESSRETLVKNVSLFKNYASIHNRQDLITFLNHCENRFSYLLVPPQKPLKKRNREREVHG